MKYYGGCDVGSTYTKAVILDETGKIVGSTTIKSKINAEESARIAMKEVLGQPYRDEGSPRPGRTEL